LAARYGEDRIHVVLGERARAAACPTRENCSNPLKGGLTINGPFVCTSAFIGTKASGNYYMYTAGQCGGAGSSWTHNGVGIGQVSTEVYQDNSSSDAGIIDIPNNLKSNLVMGAEGAPFGYTSITSKKALGVAVGIGLCKSGSTSDFDCGTVTDNDVDTEYTDGTFMLNQIRMTIQTAPGDSGGPVWINSKAYGIWSAMYSNNDGLYTQIAAAEANLATPVYFGG
jgi:streptogrisin C